MSADSPNRRLSRSSGQAQTVTPQHFTDPTILDNVAGFINEVVPNAYTPLDSKDQIQWAHFEQLECDETTFSPSYDCDKITPPALVLILGYTKGVQIWAIPANGEASQLASWRHGSTRVLRILPNPYIIGNSTIEDCFAPQRPLITSCDSTTPGAQFCSLVFLSLRTGEQVKAIKFQNPVLDVLANRRSIAVTFQEKIAIFDAFTLEDRLTVTTCYLSPGIQPNPIALGTRWLAYAEKKLNSSKRSSGGNEGEGIQSYTATVLHAAKSLGRGLRELGETVASSLTGTQAKPGTSPNSPQAGGLADIPQKGIVTILDIENPNAVLDKAIQPEAIVAHFTAHTEAIVYLQFDPSGLLLLTADKRGHDFHLFRIHPHPGGPALAAVHHLYVLHRGDTSARVQDMCFSADSRWAAVSTLRGTTHVFPITPYGGNVGVRTHATPHVVNKMSRFHRSAGLTAEGRSNSPVSLMEAPVNSHFPYHNPRFPPFPHPTVVNPLAQIRPALVQNSQTQQRSVGRQRIPSGSEEVSLRVVAAFASPRAWIDSPTNRDPTVNKVQAKAVESLFVMSGHGVLVQYDLDPHQAASIPKERVCDDTPIELGVIGKAQWVLQRQGEDVQLPLSSEALSYVIQDVPRFKKSKPDHNDDSWLSQVEIVTHAGPHRRLWMGPQFTFKTYTTAGSSINEAQPLDLGRSKPVNMPITKANAVLIESSSAGSCEQSLLDTYHRNCDEIGGIGELQLKEDLADAMLESPGIREPGGRCVIVSMKQPHATAVKVVNPLGTVVTVQSDEEVELEAPEDAVILENCDEALFRPVVAPKAVLYTEYKAKATDRMITKSLDAGTEVAVKLLDKKTRREPSPKPQPKPEPIKPKKIKETKTDPFDIPKPVVSENIKNELHSDNIDFYDKRDFDLGTVENEDFFSLESIPKLDTEKKNDLNERFQGLEASEIHFGDETTEEKFITTKKARKPKAKLGVKIASHNKENLEKSLEDCSAEITLPAPKKSWSSIAAAKPSETNKFLLDSAEKEKVVDFELPSIESVESFSINLPKGFGSCTVTKDLIDIETPKEEIKRVGTEEDALVKLDKSSDDEKGDSGSSPAETTESDDSSKLPQDTSGSIEEEEEATKAKATVPISKSAKKKLRKKRK